MWSKNIPRFSSCLRATRQKQIIAPRCCCMERVTCSQMHTSHAQNETEYRPRTHAALTLLAGLGVSLTTYMLWNKRQRLYAAEPEKSSTKTKHTSKKPKGENAGDSTSKKPKGENAGDSTSKKPSPVAGIDGGTETRDTQEEIDWSLIPDLPSHVPYLLIGSGIASVEAYKAIKTKDIKAKVLMIGEEDYLPYWRPPLSKHFWYDENKDAFKEYCYSNLLGKKSSIFLLDGVYMEPKKLPFSDKGGLALLKNTKVVQLDAVNKKVLLDNGSEISFDKCLIATGGKPKNDEVLEKAGADVKCRTTLFRNYTDLWRLSEVVQSVKSIAVIGGGFLGSELSLGLLYRGFTSGLKVHQLFPEKGHMAKVLPGFLSEWTTKKVAECGVNVMAGVSIKSAVYEDGKVKLGLSNGEYLKVDHLVVAVGIEPNTELADSANLELDDKLGGFRVNTELQARSDIWAAGDCACFYDPKLGRRRVEHFDHASITGRLAGFNMTGENKPYIHQSMFWSTLGGTIDYEAVGLVDSRLRTFAVFRKNYADTESEEDVVKSSEKSEPVKSNTGGKQNERAEPVKSNTGGKSNKKSETDKSKTKSTTSPKPKPSSKSTDEQAAAVTLEDDYDHGVIFYLRDGVIVGIVMWNLSGFMGEPSRLDIARQIIADGAKDKDLTEVAKIFNVYAN